MPRNFIDSFLKLSIERRINTTLLQTVEEERTCVTLIFQECKSLQRNQKLYTGKENYRPMSMVSTLLDTEVLNKIEEDDLAAHQMAHTRIVQYTPSTNVICKFVSPCSMGQY